MLKAQSHRVYVAVPELFFAFRVPQRSVDHVDVVVHIVTYNHRPLEEVEDGGGGLLEGRREGPSRRVIPVAVNGERLFGSSLEVLWLNQGVEENSLPCEGEFLPDSDLDYLVSSGDQPCSLCVEEGERAVKKGYVAHEGRYPLLQR